MKKFLGWSAVALSLAIGAFLLFAPSFTIDIPESKAREEIAKRLPQTIEKNGVTATVTAAFVDFLGSNAVHVIADADVSGFGLEGTAKLDVTSSLRYANGNFYLADLTIQDVDLALDETSSETLGRRASLAKGLFAVARAKLEEHSPEAASDLDQMAADAMANARPKIQAVIEQKLREIPVYSLNGRDMKHDLAALALKDVRFEDTKAEVELNPARALWTILLSAALFVLSFIAAIGITLGIFSPRGI